MPVDERTGGIRLPRPDVQGVERRQTEAIRALEQVQELPPELRCAGVAGMPGVDEHEEVRANQATAAVRQRLVNNDLGATRIQYSVPNQLHVDVVQSHGAVVGPAHAAEEQLISVRHRYVDVVKAPCGFANRADELARMLLALTRLLAIARARVRR